MDNDHLFCSVPAPDGAAVCPMCGRVLPVVRSGSDKPWIPYHPSRSNNKAGCCGSGRHVDENNVKPAVHIG